MVPIIIGVDVSSTRTGVAWEYGSASQQYSGPTHELSPSDWAWRMIEMADFVMDKAKSIGATMAIVEELPSGSLKYDKTRTVCERCGLYWRVICSLQEAGIKCHLVSPTSLKKFVTGDGRAEKPQIEREIRRLFPSCLPSNHDEADAKALCVIGYRWHSVSICEETEYQAKFCPSPPWECSKKEKKPKRTSKKRQSKTSTKFKNGC